jgi:hypothetical protein
MGIWSIDPPGLHFEAFNVSVNGPPLIYFEPLKFLNFGNNADIGDSDPASKNNADPEPAKKTHLRSINMKL